VPRRREIEKWKVKSKKLIVVYVENKDVMCFYKGFPYFWQGRVKSATSETWTCG
jgi:hypothetical protein